MDYLYPFIQAQCEQYSNSIFVEEISGKQITYKQFFLNLNKVAYSIEYYFEDIPINFCVALPNVSEFLYLVFGGIKNGGSAVNLNPDLSTDEFKFRLLDAQVKVIFTNMSTFDKIAVTLMELNIHTVIIGDENEAPFLEQIDKHISFLDLKNILAEEPEYEFTLSNYNADNKIGFLQYTGGTTGKTKAAVIEQQNVLASVMQMSSYLSVRLKVREERFVVTFPFYHVFSIVFQVLTAMKYGSTILIYPYPRDFIALKKILLSENFTVFVGVHTLYKMMLNDVDISNLKFPKTKLFIAGAEHIQPVTKKRWLIHTGHHIVEGYGLTETSALASMSVLNNNENDFDSIGIPLPDTQFKLLNNAGEAVTEYNEPGEICIKGPQVIKMYWNREEDNAVSFTDEWLHTGDIAVLKENNQYKIVDRKKDIIIVSGFNVYPNEVESVLMQYAGINDCAAVAIPDEKSNERVAAFVVSEMKIDISELIDFCKSKLTAYKVPVEIYQIDTIPKSPVGKTLRSELRQRLRNQL